jgi:phage regulator Rha-like protein
MKATANQTAAPDVQSQSSNKSKPKLAKGKLVGISHNQAFTTTEKLAKELGVKHAYVIDVLNGLFEDFEELRVVSTDPKTHKFSEKFLPYLAEYRGQSFTAYTMNQQAFTLLLPRFKTKRAKQAYRKFNQAFYELEHIALQAKVNRDNKLFQQFRIEGKQTRKSLTDAIKDFAEYSKEQGSTGYSHLYSTLTKWIYKALGIESNPSPKIRDSLNSEEIKALDDLEHDVAELICKGIDSQKHYKAIKNDIKGPLAKL